jgi:hypothetical protein
VTLVKSLYVGNYATAADTARLVVSRSGLGQFDVVHVPVEPSGVGSWEGWIVLNPDDGVYIATGGVPMYVWLSGAVLAGPPQFPPAMQALPRVEPHG